VPSASTPILEELDSLVVEPASLMPHRLIITISLIDPYRQAMSVIVVVRKVSCYTFIDHLPVSLYF
jgi:hypothetical protein